MIKRVEFKDKKYWIDTTPKDAVGLGYVRAEVLEMNHYDASGTLANVVEELTGRRMQGTTFTIVEDEDLIALAIHLGWKFSRSKAWRRLYDWAEYEWRKARRNGC